MQREILDSPSSLLKGLKVLCIDDEPDTLGLLAFVMEDVGINIRLASSVTEAMCVLAEFTPDVIATDINLPDGTGCLLANQVRNYMAEKGGSAIPIIALSGYHEDTAQSMGVRTVFQAYLEKPVEIDTLIGTIAQVTKRAIPGIHSPTH